MSCDCMPSPSEPLLRGLARPLEDRTAVARARACPQQEWLSQGKSRKGTESDVWP